MQSFWVNWYNQVKKWGKLDLERNLTAVVQKVHLF